MSIVTTRKAPAEHLLAWDAIELWVGNARAMTGFLMSSFGFRCTAYAGPETGIADRASYVLRQNDICFVVTAGLDPDSEVTAHVVRHGDGVHDLVFSVDDAAATFDAATARGATPIGGPTSTRDEHGELRTASIATYGETHHSFVDRSRYHGPYRPGYVDTGLPPRPAGGEVGLQVIDHVVGNVEDGRLQQWVAFYEDVMGFRQLRHFDESQISTDYSALRSTVVGNGGRIVMPLNEPAPGRRKSQIQEYLDSYRGAGVQHVALRTDDIVATIRELRARGVRFLETNEHYYDDVRRRYAHLELAWDDLQPLGILVDDEPDGYLLQLFTEPIADRPTLFFEVIQRGGAQGFGEGNFKALFESIEKEQARRGHL